MRNVLITAAMLAIATPPAWAWTNTTNGPGPQQIVDGGPGAQATASARAGAVARGGRASATGGSVVVNVPATSGGASGVGGQPAGAGSGSYNGNTYIDNRSPPAIGLAPLYGGGARCPTVGLTGAGSATGGGGGAGLSWYSSDCSVIELAEYERSIGHGDVGQALLAHHYPELAKVLSEMPAAPTPIAVVAPVVRPQWCDKALRNKRPTEASAAYIARECGP